MKTLEVHIPDHWTPELALATAALMNKAVRDGVPLVTSVSASATAEQVRAVHSRIHEILAEAGLAA